MVQKKKKTKKSSTTTTTTPKSDLGDLLTKTGEKLGVVPTTTTTQPLPTAKKYVRAGHPSSSNKKPKGKPKRKQPNLGPAKRRPVSTRYGVH